MDERVPGCWVCLEGAGRPWHSRQGGYLPRVNQARGRRVALVYGCCLKEAEVR